MYFNWYWINLRSYEIYGHYRINRNESGKCEIRKCYPGYEPIYGPYYDIKNRMERLNWRCVRCSQDFIKTNFDSTYCKTCGDDTLSNKNRSVCYDPYTNVYIRNSNPFVILILLFTSYGVAFNIFTIFIFSRYQNTPIIQGSGFGSSMLQLCTYMVLFITVPISVLNKPTQLKCIIQPVLIGTMMVIITTITLTKTFKALHAFNSTTLLTKSSIRKTKIVEWFVLALTLIIQIAITGLTYFTALPKINSTLDKTLFTREIYCANENHIQVQLGFIIIISIVCLVQAFRGRNLPFYFNESKRTTYSMLVSILILVICFPILLQSRLNNENRIIAIFAVILTNMLQLIVMYSYKMFVIIFRSETNTKQAFRLKMMRNAEQAAMRKMNRNKTIHNS